MTTAKLRRLVTPIPPPTEKISNLVKKKKFVKKLLENSETLSPQKITTIAREVGWGMRPQDAIKDKEVQEIVKPIADQLINIRQKVVNALNEKTFSTEKTTDLTDMMDKLTKNIQLLTGGETEKHKVVFGWDIQQPNDNNLKVVADVEIDNNSLRAEKLGNEAAYLTAEVEGVCAPPPSRENSSDY